MKLPASGNANKSGGLRETTLLTTYMHESISAVVKLDVTET